jgi:hypothetical protein
MKINYLSFTLVFVLALILNSCGPSEEERREEIEKGMKSWVGKSETELVAKWGPPTNTYRLQDGGRELTYKHVYVTGSPGYAWRDYWGNIHYSRPFRGRTENIRGFTLDNTGTIIAYRWEGF